MYRSTYTVIQPMSTASIAHLRDFDRHTVQTQERILRHMQKRRGKSLRGQDAGWPVSFPVGVARGAFEHVPRSF